MRATPRRCAAALAGVLAVGIAPSSQALPPAATAAAQAAVATDVVTVDTVHRKRQRRNSPNGGPRAYRAAPGPAPGCPGLYSWNPANPDRGYCDPGFAFHGNINGCVIDQGYGRWASCDTLR